MNLKLFISLFALLVLVSAATIQVRAQGNAAIIPIKVMDDYAVADSNYLYIVHTPAGTIGQDSLSPLFWEYKGPPVPPSFDARWVSFATYANSGYGLGFTTVDIRGIPTNATVKDTFTIGCTNGDADASSADFIYRWPVTSYMAARCDSMFLVDKTGLLTSDGSTPIGKINMLTQDSIYIFEPLQTIPSFKLQIYAYGVHLVDSLMPPLPIPTSVREISHQIPSSFRLQQNYPNPFNPTTTVRFDIQKQSVTEIAVYNLLGQKVATLISQNLMPGTYSAVWNGLTSKGLSAGSGVYFIRMTARPSDGRGGVFSSLQKIVLMK